MSDLLFTLYEADADHLAIAWGPMSLVAAIDQAIELVGECSEYDVDINAENAIRQDWFAFEIGMHCQDKDEVDDSKIMAWLCEWLTHRRNQAFTNADGSPFTMDNPAYRYFYTEEAKA